MTIIYRADSRTPDAINTADGFGARQAGYTLADARNVAQRLMDPGYDLALPNGAAPGLFQAIKDSPTGRVSLMDMVRVAKAEKSINTIHVSTDYTPACGGYSTGADAKGNLNVTYRMDVPDGHYVHFKQNPTGSLPGTPTATSTGIAGPDTGTSRPVLIMDNADPQRANFIAIASHGDELTFLTPVPLNWVQQYRTQDAGAPGGFSPWTPMPAPVLTTPGTTTPTATVTAPTTTTTTVTPPTTTTASVTPPTTPTPVPTTPGSGVAPTSTTTTVTAGGVSTPSVSTPSPTTTAPVTTSPGRTTPSDPTPSTPEGRFAHPYQNPDHQLHGKYNEAVDALKALPGSRFNDSADALRNNAVGLVHASERAKIDHIDHAAVNGASLFVIKGDPTSDSAQRAFVQGNDFKQAPVALRAPEPMPESGEATLSRGGPKTL